MYFTQGGMGPPNAMEVIVDAASALSKTKPEIYFILIGSGGFPRSTRGAFGKSAERGIP